MGKLPLSELPYALYEMLLLQQSGIYKTFLDCPLWYLSAYLICLVPFSALLKYRFFNETGIFIAPLLIYGYICRVHIHLDIWSFDSGYMFIGLLRAFAGLCVGVCCYKLSRKLNNLPLKDNARKLALGTAFAILAGVLAFIYKFTTTYADYFLVFLMAGALAVIQSGNISLPNKINNVFCILGKFSIYIYCSHWLVRFIVPLLMPNATYSEMLPIYLLYVAVYAAMVWLLSEILRKAARKIKRRIFYDTEI